MEENSRSVGLALQSDNVFNTPAAVLNGIILDRLLGPLFTLIRDPGIFRIRAIAISCCVAALVRLAPMSFPLPFVSVGLRADPWFSS